MKRMNGLRKVVRARVLDALGLFALPSKGIHILNGHMISRINPKPEIFYSLLKGLQQCSTFIRIEDAVSLIVDKQVISEPLLAFTFDDGFEECATMIAPVLEQFKINAAFFINPNFVEADEVYIKNFTENIVLSPGKRPMRWEQIRQLHQSGHIIGAHTLDHYMINTYDVNELEHQIIDCKMVIENKLNASCEYFAFPYGRLEHANLKSIEIALQHYKYAFSQSDYKNYFSYEGKIINRRHFEPNWPLRHVKYFISHEKKY